MPKMSGRGLGHTGGTLDKLESIPGFRVDLSLDEFLRVLCARRLRARRADRRHRAGRQGALRTARRHRRPIESVPLISASVMSKKLAEGSDALVLDVKCGRGAFMKTLDDALALARSLVAIGTAHGVRTEAFVTAMDAPLGRAVGNALEIRRVRRRRSRGAGPADLRGAGRDARRPRPAAGGPRDRRSTRRGRWSRGASPPAQGLAHACARWSRPRAATRRRSTIPAGLPRAATYRGAARADRDGLRVASRRGADRPSRRAARRRARSRRRSGGPRRRRPRALAAVGHAVRAGDPLLELHYNDRRAVDRGARDGWRRAVDHRRDRATHAARARLGAPRRGGADAVTTLRAACPAGSTPMRGDVPARARRRRPPMSPSCSAPVSAPSRPAPRRGAGAVRRDPALADLGGCGSCRRARGRARSAARRVIALSGRVACLRRPSPRRRHLRHAGARRARRAARDPDQRRRRHQHQLRHRRAHADRRPHQPDGPQSAGRARTIRGSAPASRT